MDTTPTTADVVGEKKEEHTNNHSSAAPAEKGHQKQAEEHSSAAGEEEDEFAPEKMLVTQLKGELARRGFRSTGRKPELVQRLKDALAGKIQPDAPPPKQTKKEEEPEDDQDADLGRGKRKRRASLKAREKTSRAAKADDEEDEDDEAGQEEEEEEEKEKPKPKRARKKKVEKAAEEEPAKEAKGEKEANFVWTPNPNAPVPPITEDDSKYMKIISWNLNGLAAVLKKNYLRLYVNAEQPDVVCFQETKMQSGNNLPNDMLGPGYTAYWNCSEAKKGYAGTAVFTKVPPVSVTYGIGIKEHDDEGRVITVEFKHFYLVNTYIPNSGQKLERLQYRQGWDKVFLAYLKKLETKKPIVWCGDLNVAHQEIDLANPKGNKKTAGFTIEERQGFTMMLENGLVDTWRHQNPDKKSFTYWSYRFSAREKGIGWRLDYFVASEKFMPEVGPTFIRPDVLGSDHCPIGVLLKKHDD